jgi:hypothetical protein
VIAAHRIRRRLALSATMLVAMSAIGGSSIVASTPTWGLSSVVTTPAKVSAGADAGYVLTVVNSGTSNISQAYVTDGLQAKNGIKAIPAQVLPTTYVTTTQGTCDPVGVRLRCALGALRAGTSATVTVAYSTASYATLRRIFEINTTGVAGDAKGSSHGDALQLIATTTTGTGADFAGRFVVGTDQTVSDSQTLGSKNKQWTKINVPATAIGVSVGENGNALACPGCWSETSEIHVDRGLVYPAGFSGEIGIYKTLAQTVHGFYHQFDTPHVGGIEGETVTATCSSATAPSVVPCFLVVPQGNGNVSVVYWLTENGTIRFN